MKFNPNQRYTRWSIRRLSVGVASVVVASGFFVLVGQPSSVRADAINPTPAQVVPDAASVSEKSDLPAEVLKKAVDVALPSEQADSTPKASLDTTSSPEKGDVAAKEPVAAPKEEVQAKPESKKETEDAVNLRQILLLQLLDKTVKQMKLNQQPLQLKFKKAWPTTLKIQ